MSQQSSKQPTLDGVALSVSKKARQAQQEWGSILRREQAKQSNADSSNTGTGAVVKAAQTLFESGKLGKLDETTQILHHLECGGEVYMSKAGYLGVCNDCGFLFVKGINAESESSTASTG